MKHVLFDLKECLITSPLDDEEYVKNTLIEAANIGKLEVLKVDTHKFQPHGVTGYALLAESHMSIHTWPEDDIVRCDLFSCNPRFAANVILVSSKSVNACVIFKLIRHSTCKRLWLR